MRCLVCAPFGRRVAGGLTLSLVADSARTPSRRAALGWTGRTRSRRQGEASFTHARSHPDAVDLHGAPQRRQQQPLARGGRRRGAAAAGGVSARGHAASGLPCAAAVRPDGQVRLGEQRAAVAAAPARPASAPSMSSPFAHARDCLADFPRIDRVLIGKGILAFPDTHATHSLKLLLPHGWSNEHGVKVNRSRSRPDECKRGAVG